MRRRIQPSIRRQKRTSHFSIADPPLRARYHKFRDLRIPKREYLSLAKNISLLSHFTLRKNSPFACWPSFSVCFGSFDCWVLGIKPSPSRT
jgi:hypothetical protein